jgi:hypothetical protein
MTLKQAARIAALSLLHAGEKQKKWTPEQRAQWTRAFNALQRLAGKKIIYRGGKLVRL